MGLSGNPSFVLTMTTPGKTIGSVEHQEAIHHELESDATTKGQGLTGYESLTVWETIKKFKLNAFICMLASVSAATDGYQIAFVYSIRWVSGWQWHTNVYIAA